VKMTKEKRLITYNTLRDWRRIKEMEKEDENRTTRGYEVVK